MFLNILLTILLLVHSYSTYKLLSQRPAPTEQLESHLIYFITLALLLPLFSIMDSFSSFLPFYGSIKAIILLVVAIPQTQASTHIYLGVVEPWLRSNETMIDGQLDRIRVETVEFGKGKIRDVWVAVLGVLGQQQQQAGNTVPDPLRDVNGPPPSMADPLSGPFQMISGWWTAYGPAIAAVASTSSLFAQPQQQQPQQQHRPASVAGPGPSTTRDQRRLALEAELAALRQEADIPMSPPVTLQSTYSTYSSSRQSTSQATMRGRPANNNGNRGFDETEDEEDEDDDNDDEDGVGYDYRPRSGPTPAGANADQPGWLGGWFSPPNDGYARTKAD